MYQGHLPDGSSIQRHSAGSHYPFIVVGRESEFGLLWGVQAPNEANPAFWESGPGACARAFETAEALANDRTRAAAQRALEDRARLTRAHFDQTGVI